MPRFSIVRCDLEKCKMELKVGEPDSSPRVFEILHVMDSTGEGDFWFCCIEHLIEWAKNYVSPYRKKEKVPLTAMLPDEQEEDSENLN
jgi:hypothetical protein